MLALPLQDTIPTPAETLSARELEILKLVSKGLRNRAIGEKLGLKEHSIKVYLHRAFDKTGMSNRKEAALWYVAHFGDPR